MLGLLVPTLFYVLLLSWTVGFMYCYKDHITVMGGMLAAMSLGMIVGIGGAMIMAILLPMDMLSTTVISVLLGALAGGSVGAFINMLALLDGVLSGVMSGMMGSMLISMLPSMHWEAAIFSSMVICGTIQYILVLILQGQISKESFHHTKWICRNPTMMLIFIGITLFVYPLLPGK
jgi:hypothetical protein